MKPLPGRPPPRRPGRFIRIGGDRWWTMSSLKELVAKQKREQVSVTPVGRAEVVLAGELVTFEFEKLHAKAWLDLVALHPPRSGSSTDVNIGFNVHSLAPEYPVESVRIVETEPAPDDTPEGVEPEVIEHLHEVTEEDYRDMFSVLDAIHIDTIATVLWSLNVLQDRLAVAAARKASKGEPSKKPSSPEN